MVLTLRAGSARNGLLTRNDAPSKTVERIPKAALLEPSGELGEARLWGRTGRRLNRVRILDRESSFGARALHQCGKPGLTDSRGLNAVESRQKNLQGKRVSGAAFERLRKLPLGLSARILPAVRLVKPEATPHADKPADPRPDPDSRRPPDKTDSAAGPRSHGYAHAHRAEWAAGAWRLQWDRNRLRLGKGRPGAGAALVDVNSVWLWAVFTVETQVVAQ